MIPLTAQGGAQQAGSKAGRPKAAEAKRKGRPDGRPFLCLDPICNTFDTMGNSHTPIHLDANAMRYL